MTAITIYELRNIFDGNTVFYAQYTYQSSLGDRYTEKFVIPNLLYGTNSFADIKVYSGQITAHGRDMVFIDFTNTMPYNVFNTYANYAATFKK